MPKYRIISELDSGRNHRKPRGLCLRPDEKRLVTTIEAPDLATAVDRAPRFMADQKSHLYRRIISVEEVHPGVRPSDAQITTALTLSEGDWTDEPMIDPDAYDPDEPIYGDGDFIWTVNDIADALRESGLVPGLHLSLLQGGDGFVDYSMVEVHDDARMIYLSCGSEIKHLTDDRSATGWAGIVAIARALIQLSNDLH